MIDASEPPRRGSSGSIPAMTPIVEARNALIEARKLVNDLEHNTNPAFGKLKETNADWHRLRRMLSIIGEALKAPDDSGGQGT